jgi:3-phosphoshikimate 1-carboxyvinyltransferase
VKGAPLSGVDVDMNAFPDSVQTLAAIASFASGPTRIRNVANLRVKETDRIEAVTRELEKLGGKVDPSEDGLLIHPAELHGGKVHTYGDHRMAMSFAVTALHIEGIEIEDPNCVRKSFPGFFDQLELLLGR